jgi:hypothetical protein
MLRAYQCPFFRWEENHIKIHCEGGMITFKDAEAMTDYIDAFCANHPGWEGCTVAQNVNDFYERKEKSDETEH